MDGYITVSGFISLLFFVFHCITVCGVFFPFYLLTLSLLSAAEKSLVPIFSSILSFSPSFPFPFPFSSLLNLSPSFHLRHLSQVVESICFFLSFTCLACIALRVQHQLVHLLPYLFRSFFKYRQQKKRKEKENAQTYKKKERRDKRVSSLLNLYRNLLPAFVVSDIPEEREETYQEIQILLDSKHCPRGIKNQLMQNPLKSRH